MALHSVMAMERGSRLGINQPAIPIEAQKRPPL